MLRFSKPYEKVIMGKLYVIDLENLKKPSRFPESFVFNKFEYIIPVYLTVNLTFRKGRSFEKLLN